MKGSNIRRAEQTDAESIRQLYQTSIRRLCASHYTPEQIQRWTDRPIEAFQGDIQNSLVLVMEFHGKIMGFAQMVRATGEVLAVYVHPDHARQNIGSFLIMWLQVGAYDDDLARLTVNAPLNAVEFFRSREFIEVGPGSIALDDGTCLPAVKMEHLVYQPLVFADDQSLADVHISAAALLAALATSCVPVDAVYRVVGWKTIVLVAGMMPLATARNKTGVTTMIAHGLVGRWGRRGPRPC